MPCAVCPALKNKYNWALHYNQIQTQYTKPNAPAYKSLVIWRSSYLEELAKERNKELNKEAKAKAAEYFLKVMILQLIIQIVYYVYNKNKIGIQVNLYILII